MTFEEMRVRLANRDAIREKQEAEERAEEERELEEAARLRREQRELERSRLKMEDSNQVLRKVEQTVAAAADTSSEVERKIKERFLKETSKVVVKVLDPYRRDDATVAKIKTNEDFKHIAKKVARNFDYFWSVCVIFFFRLSAHQLYHDQGTKTHESYRRSQVQ